MNAFASLVNETVNIADAAYNSSSVDYSDSRYFADKELASIDRIRVISEPGTPFWDLSYVWGTLKNGKHVPVEFPVYQFTKRATITAQLIKMCKSENVYGKGLGMFEAGVLSKLN